MMNTLTLALLASLSALPGFKRTGSDELYPVSSKIAGAIEGGFFRFTAETATPPDGIRKRVPRRPSGAAPHPELDDAYAFDFPKRFVVNARGASNVAIEGLETTSVETNGVWTFGLKVPLASVGGLPADGKLKVVRLFTGTDAALGKRATATLALASGDAPGLSAFELGTGDKAGFYPVRIAVTNPSATARTVKLAYLGRPVNSQPCAIERTLTLAPGATEEVTAKGAVLDDEAIHWTLKLTEGGKTLADEKGVHRPNFGGLVFAPRAGAADRVGFKFSYFPSYNALRARIDASSLGTCDGIGLKLRAKGGQVIDSWTPAFGTNAVSDVTRTVPDLRPLTVKSGSPDYELVLTAPGGIEIVRPFQRAAMEWEGNKFGLSDKVPAPFEKVKVERFGSLEGLGGLECCKPVELEKGSVVKVVLRDYTIGDFGLWKQVNAADKDILARPMTLKTSQTSQTFQTSQTYDVDGLMDWRLTLKPGHYEPMALEIPLKAGEARLMHACVDGLRNNYGGRVPAGTGRVWDSAQTKSRNELKGSYMPYLWVGGSLRGIAVFGDNDKGWVLGDLVPCQEIVRETDGTVVVRLNLVQKAVDLTEARTIRIGFMATPVKPMPENWRALPFGEFYGASLCWGGLGGVEPADGTDAFFRKLAEARRTGKVDEKFLADYLVNFPFVGQPGSAAYTDDYNRQKHHHKAGMNWAARAVKYPNWRSVFYTNARGVEYGNESGRTYLDEWSRVEWKDRNYGRREKRDYELDPVASYRDYAAWWYRKMFETGACDDMYWDDIYASANSDLVGTDAYVLPDGRIQPSVGIFNMRALIRRCAVVQAELGMKGGANWVHMTDTAMAPICSFAGVDYDMEDVVRAGMAYQEKYPKAYLEAVSTGRQFGNRPKAMAYYTKTTPEKNAWYERTGAGIMLCYEIDWMWNMKVYQTLKKKLREWGYTTDSVRIWNYFNEDEAYPLVVDRADDCASLTLAKKDAGEAIVVLSDFSGKGGVFNLKPDEKALGLKPGWKAYDFETGKPAELALTVEPYDFRAVIFKQEEGK